MIDRVDHQLAAWADSVAPGVPVSFAAPAEPGDGPGISFLLVELHGGAVRRSVEHSAIQVTLRYVVTASAADDIEAHRLLGDLLFEAMDNPEFSVSLEPQPAGFWTALSSPPRPSFLIEVPLRKAVRGRDAPLVRGPLTVEPVATAELCGVVLGPEDQPIAGAWIEVPALERAVQSDRRGRFRFPLLPADGEALDLRVRAKGREMTLQLAEIPANGEQLVIRFNPAGG